MKIVNDENGISYNIFEDTGTTICTLTDSNGKTYQGAAYCHEADRDMQSEKVGMAIANARAKIALYKFLFFACRFRQHSLPCQTAHNNGTLHLIYCY